MGESTFVAWAKLDAWGRPGRWSKIHETCVDERGEVRTVCGAAIPKNIEGGGEFDGDGYCRRCQGLSRARR